MSQSEWECAFQPNNSQALFTFAFYNVQSGSYASPNRKITQIITTPGVDNQRFMTRKEDREPLVLLMKEPIRNTVNSFIQSENYIAAMQGELGTLTLRDGPLQQVWKNAMCLSVNVSARQAKLIGFGEVTGADKTLTLTCQFILPQESNQ